MRLERDDDAMDLGGRWWFAVSDRRLPVGGGTADDLRAAGAEVMPATVPGNVELDLLANGRVEEPFRGMNIAGRRGP